MSLQKIQARATVPKHFLPAYSQMLHLKKKEYVMVTCPTVQTNKWAKTNNKSPIDTVVKSVKS